MIQSLHNQFGQFSRQSIPTVRWDHFDLICIYRGELAVQFESATVRAHDRQAILIYPKTRFTARSISPLADVSVHHFTLDASAHRLLGQSLRDCRDGCDLRTPTDWTTLRGDLSRLTRGRSDPSPLDEKQFRHALLLLVLDTFLRARPHPEPQSAYGRPLAELVDYLHANPHRAITLDAMADRVGLSVSHFRAVFAETMGTTPGRYFLDLRMQLAARRLRETLEPVKEISRSVGYDDVAHFSRAFGRQVGQSPAAYRRRHRLSI